MNTIAMLKYRWFKDNESDKTISRVEKCQCLDEHNNKEWQGLDKYKGENEGTADRYVSFPFNALLFPP